MTVVPIGGPDADVPLRAPGAAAREPGGFAASFGRALDAAAGSLARADAAERAFAAGHGGLQEMVLERARADITLAIASAAASRVTQAVTTLLGMQI